MKFNIDKYYWDDDIKMYERSSVDILPGVTVLVGCNGIGKSTLICQIKSQCKQSNIPSLEYDMLEEGGNNMMDSLFHRDMMEELAVAVLSSEGEKIKQSIYHFASKYTKFMHSIEKDQQHLFFFFDAIDSGYSVDNVLEVKRNVFDAIIETCDNANKEAYIIVSANEYELCRNENCLILPELKYREIKSYDTYRKIILKSRKKKDLIYGYREFDYE